MAEKRRKITAQSAALDEAEDYQQQAPWNELSPYVLERIYSFLCRKDQVNMSVVCRSWSEGYGMPSVWKEFDFYLSESQLSTSHRFYMKYAEKYSTFFRHVRIYCQHFSNVHMYNIWSRRFVYFLEILTTNSQLESVEFRCLGFCLGHVDGTKMYETITTFLKSQHDLKMVLFYYCRFSYEEGDWLFKILAETSGKSLQRLFIRKFFANETNRAEISNALEEFPRIRAFTKLETLETDFSVVLEYLLAFNSHALQKFEKKEMNALSKVVLHYREFALMGLHLSQGVTSEHWKILIIMFPDMQVEIFIEDEENMIENMQNFIKANMPITNLVYFYTCEEDEIEIQALFKHLLACKINEYLKTLAFQCTYSNLQNFNAFILFVQDCPKLERLALQTVDPLNAINLMESWMNIPRGNQSENLKNVYIVDSHFKNSSAYSNLIMTFQRISPRLRFNLELSDCLIFQKFITYP